MRPSRDIPDLGNAGKARYAEAGLSPDHPDAETWRSICDLVDVQFSTRNELIARFVGIYFGAAIIYWLMRDPIGVYWAFAYSGFALASRLYLGGIKAPGSLAQFRIGLLLSAGQSATFIFIVFYAATVAPPSAAMGPFAGIAGFAYYNLAKSKEIPALIIWEGILTVAATIWASVFYVELMGLTNGAYAAVVVAIIVSIYAAFAAWSSLRTRHNSVN